MALFSPFCWPVSVRMVTSTLAATFPVFIRYSRVCAAPSDCPVPANHMSEPGWVQLTSPVPDASDCSASNPSAIRPDAATAVPSPPDTLTVATVPSAVTDAPVAVFAPALDDAEGLPDADAAPDGEAA